MNPHETLEDHWRYNCEDCCRTFEIAQEESKMISSMNLHQAHQIQQSMFSPVLQTMIWGIRIDLAKRAEMAFTLKSEMQSRLDWITQVLGHPLNPRSPKQMQALFYKDLHLPPVIKRGTGRPTLDDDALTKLSYKEPLLRPLLRRISEYRSLGVFLETFVQAPLDEDNRMRCSYNICGTETYRLASRENAFGSGTNLQNVPKGFTAKEPEDLSLPNIRTLFIPDDGYTFFDGDLDRADLYVVVWEVDDADLKLALRKGIDMHLMNACAIFNIKGIPYEELSETHPNYKEHRKRIGDANRQRAKQGVHATNYGCKGRTLAIHLGSTVHEADRFISNWLSAHPQIKRWHDKTETQLRRTRSVANQFGYRRFYFDRPDHLLPEALAWIPQSTVAITINKIWLNIYERVKEVQVLLQVHDSLAGQMPTHLAGELKPAILRAARVVIPYQDPLIIPFSLKTSKESWGACE